MEHSVTLDKKKCKGCTTCIKNCPTEAIRVRKGKATIIRERCIDCGECIRCCPNRAKRAVCDPMSRLNDFKYNIALPAPSLYGQFHNMNDVNIVLAGLLEIGFDDVFEVSAAAEMISELGRTELREDIPRPVISNACPACVRLICQRFPKLIPNISPFYAPVELAAVLAKDKALSKTGLNPEEIGVFFITPCPAKVTAAHYPMGMNGTVIDGAISMTEIYLKLLPAMRKVPSPPPHLSKSGIIGIGWAISGGESVSLIGKNQLAVDGIKNVIDILEDIEDGKHPEFEFIEIGACTQGCVGGCLAVENPYAAKNRVRNLKKHLPVSVSHGDAPEDVESITRNVELVHRPIWQLDDDISAAMEKHSQIVALHKSLPGLDCGSCGAPSCRALAEDVVLGFAKEADCIFYMRDKMENEDLLPPPFRKSDEEM